MFNPEKLLGGMLRTGSRRGGLGGLVSGGAALGLIGVAMEAVEHYTNKSRSTQPVPPPPGPAQNGASAPPTPPVGQTARPKAPPPPPMGKVPGPPPGPKAESENAHPEGHSDAILLIRAMIAAANADGTIDQEERSRILKRLQSAELSHEEQAFIANELLMPKALEEIVREVKSPEMARQVYAVSLMAINVDTDAERNYLKGLAHHLGLDDSALSDIHQQLGLQSV